MFLASVDQSRVDTSTEKWLDKIEESIDYKAWFCGHWHTDKRIDKIHFLFHSYETEEMIWYESKQENCQIWLFNSFCCPKEWLFNIKSVPKTWLFNISIWTVWNFRTIRQLVRISYKFKAADPNWDQLALKSSKTRKISKNIAIKTSNFLGPTSRGLFMYSYFWVLEITQ